MSRLIDADALTEWIWRAEVDTREKISQIINNQPTVDAVPVVHGQWEESNPQNSKSCRLIKCSKCGFTYIVGFNVPYEDWIEDRNYCTRCGAKMDEVTE